MELETKLVKRYNYILLQYGTLPLTPGGAHDYSVEHRSTSVLIWLEDEQPSFDNTVLTDPCFTSQGFQYAIAQLEQLNLSFLDIGRFFVTHPHNDHVPNLSHFIDRTDFTEFQEGANKALSGIVIALYPGHAPNQQGLIFRSCSDQKMCISGDAILDIEWLKAWRYYWPNGYTTSEIVETWESVGKILSFADRIIPGHGQPIPVTAPLIEDLLVMFPSAEYASECQDVEQILSKRLDQLLAEERK
jgi:glyoxylase-like metal-dependent hydrolase (beta-lactamase superfamily II)